MKAIGSFGTSPLFMAADKDSGSGGVKKKKKRTPPPENETAAQKFSRLGTVRLNKAKKAIKVMRALAGKGYESTQQQRDLIFKTLEGEMAKLKTAFTTGGVEAEPEVKL